MTLADSSRAAATSAVPSTDGRSFRGAFRGVAASVAVMLTSTNAGGVRGLTCTSAVSLSACPPMALVCVDVRTGFCELVRQSGGFSINYLAERFAQIATAFAGNDDDLSHLSRAVVAGRTGVPTLAYGTISVLECVLDTASLAGDHWIVTGHISHARYQFDEDPLVYTRGSYRGTRHLAQQPVGGAA